MRSKPLRRLLALFLVILLAGGGLSTRLYAAEPKLQFIGEAAAIRGAQQLPSAAGSGVFTLPVEVRFCQTEARKELDMINALRTGGNAWYWNSSNTEKIYVNGLSALQYDYDLEKVAMQRAAEIAVYYDHYRPDGNICWQTYKDIGYSCYTAGENIAAGYTSAEAVFVGWAEEDEYYSGQGHRRNMLDSDFTAVGCACVYYEGIYYWVQNFGSPVHNTTKTTASDGNETRNVLVKNENAGQWALTETEPNINCNEPTDILDLLRVRYLLSAVGWDYAQGMLRSSMLKLDWQPKDTSIVTYKDGILTGKAPGSTTMTAQSPDGGTTLTVTVHVTGTASAHNWQNIQYEWSEDLHKVTASATCSHCSETLQETVNTTATVTTQATCTANGKTTYTAVFTNPVFSEQKRTAEDIPALGHDIVADAAVEATCTEPGLTAGEHCTRCDYRVAQTVIPALGHDIIADAAVEATCTEPGLTAGEHCTRCDYKVAQTVIPALGHNIVEDPEIPATCTEPGLTAGEHCTRCDYRIEQQIAPVLGHVWLEGEIEPPTETEDGLLTWVCTRCGAIKTEVIPATGEGACKHENAYPDQKDATCTEDGYDKMICSNCGAVISEVIVPALGHDIVADAAVAATCTEPGLTAGEHCGRCDYKIAQETVPALGHAWDEGKVTTQPTATSEGVKTITCSRCGATKTEAIPATGEDDKPCDGGKDCPSYKFRDVNYGDWYHEAIDFAVTNGLFNGMTETTFEPNTAMSRAMLVTVLWRYEGCPYGGQSYYSDVPNGQWYTEAVTWAAYHNIVYGVGNGRFDPSGNITREQLAAILFRYADKKGCDISARGSFAGYPDAAKISSWAISAYAWAVGEGLITGNDGKLDPQGNATRAQVATILMRFIKNIKAAESYDTQGHTYEFIRGMYSWEDAQKTAAEKGGYLVRFDSEEEFKYVAEKLSRSAYQNTAFIIGARRAEGSRDYYFVDGSDNPIGSKLNATSSWTSAYWTSGEPTFEWGGEQEWIVALEYQTDLETWMLNDVPDNAAYPADPDCHGFIIEYEP